VFNGASGIEGYWNLCKHVVIDIILSREFQGDKSASDMRGKEITVNILPDSGIIAKDE
jgi:hypothetical protein